MVNLSQILENLYYDEHKKKYLTLKGKSKNNLCFKCFYQKIRGLCPQKPSGSFTCISIVLKDARFSFFDCVKREIVLQNEELI